MALSTKKKNIIIADWKTGAFTKKELEKKHKISFKTLDKLVSGISLSNAEAVVVLHGAEMVKNSIKNPVELKAVENVVKSRLKVDDISSKLLNLVEKKIDNNVKYEKVNAGMGVQNLEPTELESIDFKNLADTIDKVSITMGVNERFSSSKVEINNANNQQTNNKIEIVLDE